MVVKLGRRPLDKLFLRPIAHEISLTDAVVRKYGLESALSRMVQERIGPLFRNVGGFSVESIKVRLYVIPEWTAKRPSGFQWYWKEWKKEK